jgi:hypothetical protein
MEIDPQLLKKTTLARVQDKPFWVCRGDHVDNIKDLANCIESLSHEQFMHHVSAEPKRNDFAQWIFDVLKNPSLARDLNYPINLTDQKHCVKTIRDHIAWLESI